MYQYPTRSELSQVPESVRFSSVLSPHHIRSSPTCDHYVDACECPFIFSCPLCPLESLSLVEVETHYTQVHWDAKIFVGSKFVVFPCGLMHATARQSIISRNNFGHLHFHCPLCPLTSISRESLLQHFATSHPTQSSSVTLLTYQDCVVERPGGVEMTGRTGFSPIVRIREFPLALSIMEQAGGRSETKKPPTSFANYGRIHDLIHMTQIDFEVIGCNRPVMRLFQDCCFLVCGVDLGHHTLTAIYSLGGMVTGASYQESVEWTRITHILLGDRIGPKSIKALRRIASNDDRIKWISSDWVRERVEKGSLVGTQKIFEPALIEKYFSLATRPDRRKSQRAPPLPDLPVIASETSRRPSPVLEEISFQFRSTPEASPLPSGVVPPIPQNENTIPFMISPEPSAVNFLPRMSKIISAPEAATPLRRSRRSAVIVSPGKFAHHSIKKE